MKIAMSGPRRIVRAVLLYTTLIVAASACGGSTITAEDAPPADADTTSSTLASAPETPTTAAATTEAAPIDDGADATAEEVTEDGSTGEGDDSEDGEDEDDGSCIEGDWTISQEELNSYYTELGAVSGVPMSATGTTRLRFIDFQYVYDAVFELEMDLNGQIATAYSDGVASGSYVFEDGIISTERGASSLSIVVNVGGFEIDAGEFGNDLLTSFPINDAPYSCDGPTVFFDTGVGTQHPVVLTPYEG